MKQLATQAIILARTNYGEADRILTVLTPDHGKLRLLAKGVRRVKSKLAGGIELFSVSEITFIKGRGEIGTLVSTRLNRHYRHIVEDLPRTMLGYDLIKQLHKTIEDQAEAEYFELLQQTFVGLDDPAVPLPLLHLWFQAQLLRLGGHTPNLATTADGTALQPQQHYDFLVERMGFAPNTAGRYTADHIKFLRLAFANHPASVLARVQGSGQLVATLEPLLTLMVHHHA